MSQKRHTRRLGQKSAGSLPLARLMPSSVRNALSFSTFRDRQAGFEVLEPLTHRFVGGENGRQFPLEGQVRTVAERSV